MANQFTSNMSKNIGTTPVSIFTCPNSTQTTIIGMSAANTLDAQAIKVSVYITRSGIDYYIVKNVDVIIGSTQVLIGAEQKVVLVPGDIVKVVSNTAASVDAIISVLNIT